MDALEKLENLIDNFINEAEAIKDKVRILDTDNMIIVNEKTIEALEELDDILSSLNDLSYNISYILNWKD